MEFPIPTDQVGDVSGEIVIETPSFHHFLGQFPDDFGKTYGCSMVLAVLHGGRRILNHIRCASIIFAIVNSL